MMSKLLPATGALAGLCLLAGFQSDARVLREGPEAPCVWLSDEVIGMKVVSSEGEALGKIDDIVVHPGGEVAYAVLSFGGWMGAGDKLFAMPWTVLRATQADPAKEDGGRSLVLPLAKERLRKAPGFDKQNWPTMANADWAKEIDAYYAGDRRADAKRPMEAATRASVISWKGSELKGFGVVSPSGEKLGDVREIAIDTAGRASYAVLSVGGFLGIRDRLVAVPWDALKSSLGGPKGDEKHLTLTTTKDQLERAPRYEGGEQNRSRMCGPEWIGEVYAHFDCRPYWIDRKDAHSTPEQGRSESGSRTH